MASVKSDIPILEYDTEQKAFKEFIMKQHIHIFGASGSGTTTIAKEVCEKLGYAHFDSDSYFWLNTVNPFTVEREKNECLDLMKNDLSTHEQWILSGSLTGWGDALVPFFDLVIFVYVSQDVRLKRLKKREYERYGAEILPGGKRYDDSNAFLEWAASYDAGTRNGRSLPKHEKWLKSIECQVLKITNEYLDDSVNTVIKVIKSQCIV